MKKVFVSSIIIFLFFLGTSTYAKLAHEIYPATVEGRMNYVKDMNKAFNKICEQNNIKSCNKVTLEGKNNDILKVSSPLVKESGLQDAIESTNREGIKKMGFKLIIITNGKVSYNLDLYKKGYHVIK